MCPLVRMGPDGLAGPAILGLSAGLCAMDCVCQKFCKKVLTNALSAHIIYERLRNRAVRAWGLKTFFGKEKKVLDNREKVC